MFGLLSKKEKKTIFRGIETFFEENKERLKIEKYRHLDPLDMFMHAEFFDVKEIIEARETKAGKVGNTHEIQGSTEKYFYKLFGMMGIPNELAETLTRHLAKNPNTKIGKILGYRFKMSAHRTIAGSWIREASELEVRRLSKVIGDLKYADFKNNEKKLRKELKKHVKNEFFIDLLISVMREQPTSSFKELAVTQYWTGYAYIGGLRDTLEIITEKMRNIYYLDLLNTLLRKIENL